MLRICSYILCLASFTILLPQGASAHTAERAESFVLAAATTTADTELVPGGDTPVFLAFSVSSADSEDTLKSVSVFVQATNSTFPGDSVIAKMRLYNDVNNNQDFDPATDVFIAEATPPAGAANKTADTVLFTFSSINRRLPNASTESYIILIKTQHDLLGLQRDTIQAVIKQFGISINNDPGADVTRPSLDTTFPIFRFRPDTTTVTISALNTSETVVHADSRVAGAITLMRGTITGESRTIYEGDSLVRFGVAVRASSNRNVDSVFVLLGAAARRVEMSLNYVSGLDTFWSTGVIDTKLRGSAGTETFIVKAYIDTVFVDGETVSATIPADSVATKFRFGIAAATDSSGIITIDRPRLALVMNTLGAITVHSDTRAGQVPVLALSGRIDAASVSNHDTITTFGVFLQLGGGVDSPHIDSVVVAIEGVSGLVDTFALPRVSANTIGGESYQAQLMTKGISDSAYFRVYVTTNSLDTISGSIIARISRDSIQTLFRDSGPATSTFDRTITVDRPRMLVASDSLGNIIVHPNPLAGVTPTIVGSGYIRSDTFLGDTLTFDTITGFGVFFETTITAAAPTLFDSVSVVLWGTTGMETFTLTRVQNAAVSGESYAASFTKDIAESVYFQIYVDPHDTIPNGTTITAKIHRDSITSIFRDSGPQTAASFSRRVTFERPEVVIRADSLGNLVVHPDSRVGQVPVLLGSGEIKSDSASVGNDTLIQFSVHLDTTTTTGADFIDSVYVAIAGESTATLTQIDTFALTRVTGSLLTNDTWFRASIGRRILDSAPFRIYALVRETAPANATIRAVIRAESVATSLRDTGPASDTHFSRIVTFLADTVTLTMVNLGDTVIPPWALLKSNPVLVLDGYIYTDSGAALQPTYDTLTRFGVSFETSSPDITRMITAASAAESGLVSVSLALFANSIRPADTITLSQDSALNNGLRWKLPVGGDTTIDTAQRFRVYLTVASTESFLNDTVGSIYDTVHARIPVDSVATSFTSAAGPAIFDTHSSRTLRFRYADTTYIENDTTLADTTVNPDTSAGNNPFIIFKGTVRGQTNFPNGQQWLASAGDTLTYFAIDIFDFVGENSADSIESVVMYWGPTETPAILTQYRADTDAFGFRIVSWKSANNLGLRIPTTTNFETFTVRATCTTVIALGSRVQSRMLSDSAQTFFMADSSQANVIVGPRRVTFNRASFGVTVSALTDSTVSPFRVRNDSTPVMTGNISSAQSPADSIIRFGIRMTGSSGIFGESISFRVKFDTGPNGRAPFESTMVLVNTNSTSPAFRINDTFSIDSGTAFTIRVVVNSNVQDTLAGETLTVVMPADSTAALYTSGGNALATSGRVVRFNYNDTLTITDSALGSINVRPNLVLGENPFVAWSGRFSNASGLSDSVQRIQFKFVGTATASGYDSISSAFVTLASPTTAQETVTLIRLDTTSWGVTLFDSAVAAGSSMTCTLYVQMHETVVNGSTITATIPSDSVSFRMSGDTSLFTASRTVTLFQNQMNILTAARDTALPDNLQRGDTREIMWFHAISDVEADTLSSLSINIRISDTTAIDTLFLVRDGNRNRRYDTNLTGQRDTYIGVFRWPGTQASGETWTLTIATGAETEVITDTVGVGKKSDTAEYLVVVQLKSSANVSTIQASIPALGADGPFTQPGPAAKVSYDTYSIVGVDSTPPLPVASFTVTANAGAFSIAWTASASGDTGMAGGQYNLYWDSAAGTYPNTLIYSKTHDTGVTSYSTSLSGLVADATYRFRMVAQDSAGNQSISTAIVSAVFRSATALPSQASVVFHQPIAADRITRNVRTTLIVRVSDKSTANLVTGVRFDTRPASSSSPFTQLGAIVTDTIIDQNGEVYYTTVFDATASAFTPDSYEFRAVAQTAAGFDSYPQSISVEILAATDTANATLVSIPGDSRLSADSNYLERVISTIGTDPVEILLSSPSGSFDLVITLVQGALGSGNDTGRFQITIQKDTFIDSGINAFRAAGIRLPTYWAEVTIKSTTTSQRNPDTRLVGIGNRIVLSYVDRNNDFLEDSTGIDMRKAVIYTLNGATGLVEALTTERDHTRKILFATITHFSPFAISDAQGVNNQGLNRLIIGPNPFRPNDGNDETGKPWVAGDATTGVIFRNVPPNAKIEIFTILGERITTLTNTATGATVAWSVKNDDNRDVASGYYLYVVTDPATSQRATGKIAVIR